MLTISQEQLAALDAKADVGFAEELIVHVRQHFAEQTKGFNPESLKVYVGDTIEEAKSYGITEKQNICTFLNIKILLKAAQPFTAESHPWVIDMLTDKRLGTADNRLVHLARRVDARHQGKGL